ncbi:ethanolamine ammonia-lyase subunit EutC [Agarivorans sp. TSD2052]|uniref:ethanolamine ammonia-lyase subunit EutC n=1 Tax=Agarivorans sp. TSD2052 TaxID=2937286 RepID=UPI00200BFB69|nr:ethanolamine ammonia-lyase subunit EutC [Agarivorans sp. TSD2052]UPW17884.1 ethanolamine ammonia-lyase subunit EutC [Agarivorans sp. TSD2052]
MTKQKNITTVKQDDWHELKQLSDARIALGRAGVSLPSQHQLAFQLAHAQAQDAVHYPLALAELTSQLEDVFTDSAHSIISLHSKATDRARYLQRPDLGRRLDADSVKQLESVATKQRVDLAIVIADGLSALAISQHACAFLGCLFERFEQDPQAWTLAPVSIVQQGRVAIGDEIGQLLNADAVLVLIGERPGLSSPDSMGLYMTWQPKLGLSDEARNCISNVRTAGLSYQQAANKQYYLLAKARSLKLSGVALKEDYQAEALVNSSPTQLASSEEDS